jgi:hypothetical protein
MTSTQTAEPRTVEQRIAAEKAKIELLLEAARETNYDVKIPIGHTYMNAYGAIMSTTTNNNLFGFGEAQDHSRTSAIRMIAALQVYLDHSSKKTETW